MNEEVMKVLQSFREALDYLQAQNIQLNEKIDGLSEVLYDDILIPARMELESQIDDDRFSEFSSKYGESLSPLKEQYAALYDGNDISRDVYDTYREHEGEYEEEVFVEEAIASIKAAIESAKAAFGIPADEPVSVEETPEGDVAITTAGGDVIVAGEDLKEETPVEAEETVEIDSPEEVAAYEAELEKQLKR